ncbi:MAG: hypothetical protein JO149_04660 [Gammaproteobacteria bacterium]|nr:hypothetical protein [Gammaproteobacteria bacterium]
MLNRKTTFSFKPLAWEQLKKRGRSLFLFFIDKFLRLTIGYLLLTSLSYAQSDDGLGQIIQIQTRFHSFVGKPTWLLIIRDLDHNQNIPYWFQIRRGENTWIAFTHSRNYLIVASNLQFETYQAKENRYKKYKINNFCQLQSFGKIQRGTSLSIFISGHLSPNTDTFSCQTSTYQDANFSITE